MTIIAAGVPPRTKPLLRGLIHELAFDLAASAGVLRVAAARGPAAKLGCALYAASLAGLLGISALYHRFVLIALAILLGWISVAYLPAVHAATAPPVTVLLAVRGGLYSLGALAYALRRPDPWPRVFGYHEIFHALVVLAAGCHFAAIAAALPVLAA